MDVLRVTVDGVDVGLPIADVIEAVRAVAITPLPGAPPVVEGLIDYRGTIAPVFDLRLRLKGTHVDVAVDHHLIIARAVGQVVALHVDSIVGIVGIEASEVKPAGGHTVEAPHLAGVISLPDGLLFIHNLATFLSEAERDSLATALADARVAG